MNIKSIREELAKLLLVPVEELTDDKPLEKFENWDSLAQVSLIASIVESSGNAIQVDELESILTVGELRTLVERHLPGGLNEAHI